MPTPERKPTPAEIEAQRYADETDAKLHEGDQPAITADNPRVMVHGSVESGWLVETHDGTTHRTYWPDAATAEEAEAEAKRMWAHDKAEAQRQSSPSPQGVSAIRDMIERGLSALLQATNGHLSSLSDAASSHVAAIKATAANANQPDPPQAA